MFMRNVTLQMEKITDARVNISNPPRLLDGQTGIVATRSNKPVHAPIKVGELEAIFFEEPNNLWVAPISASPRPLDGYSNTERDSEVSNFLDSFPQFPKLTPVCLDLTDHRATTEHVDVGP